MAKLFKQATQPRVPDAETEMKAPDGCRAPPSGEWEWEVSLNKSFLV
jgi:hypothetical protein